MSKDAKFNEPPDEQATRAGLLLLGWAGVLIFGFITLGWEFIVLYGIGTWAGFYFCWICTEPGDLDTKIDHDPL